MGYDSTAISTAKGGVASGTAWTWTHTATAGATVIVAVDGGAGACGPATGTASVTYGGTPMTSVGFQYADNVTASRYVWVFMLSGVTGGASTVSVTLTQVGATFSGYGASYSYTNVTSVGALQSSFGFSTSPSLTASAANITDMVWGHIVVNGNTLTNFTLTPRQAVAVNFNAGDTTGSTSPIVGLTASANTQWACVALDIQMTTPAGVPSPYSSAVSTNQSALASGTPFTWADTTPVGSTNIYGIVFVDCRIAEMTTPTASVTWGGASMTSLGQAYNNNTTTSGWGWVFGLANPPSGTQTISVTLTQAGQTFYGNGSSYSYTGVASVGALQTATGSSTTPSLTATALDTTDIVWGAITSNATLSAFSLTNQRFLIGFNSVVFAAGDTTGSTSVTISATQTSTVWSAFGLDLSSTTPGQWVDAYPGQIVSQAFAAGPASFSGYDQTQRFNAPYAPSTNLPLLIGDAPGATSDLVDFTAVNSTAWASISIPMTPNLAPTTLEAATFSLGGGTNGYGSLTAVVPGYVTPSFIIGVKEYLYFDQFGHGTLTATATIKNFRLTGQTAGQGALKTQVGEFFSFTATNIDNIGMDFFGHGQLTVGQPVFFDAVGAGFHGAGTPSWLHTITGNAVIVFASVYVNSATPTVTASVGSTPMILLSAGTAYATGADFAFTYAFALLNPPTGSQTISMTCTGTHFINADSLSYVNVSSFATPATAIDSVGSNPSMTVSSAPGQMVAQAFGGFTIAFSAYNQTQRYNQVFINASNLTLIMGDAAGANSVTFSATGSQAWGGVGVAMIPLSGASVGKFALSGASSGKGTLVGLVPGTTTASFVQGVKESIILFTFAHGALTATARSAQFKQTQPLTGRGVLTAKIPDVTSSSFVVGQKFGIQGLPVAHGALTATASGKQFKISAALPGKGVLSNTVLGTSQVPSSDLWNLSYTNLINFLTTGSFADLSTAWNDLVAAVENSFTGGGGTANFFSGIVTTINNALKALLPAAWDNSDGTASAQAGATITINADGTANLTPVMGSNPLLSLIDNLNGTMTTPASALQNLLAPGLASGGGSNVPATATLGQQIIDFIDQAVNGGSNTGNPTSSVIANLQSQPYANILGNLGADNIGATIQAAVDSLWQAITGQTTTGNTLAALSNVTSGTASGVVNTLQGTTDVHAMLIANRAVTKPTYQFVDPTADGVFNITTLSGTSPTSVAVTPDYSLIGFIGTPDAGVKQSIAWIGGNVVTGITSVVFNVYSVNTSTGLCTLLFTSANLFSALVLSNTWNWNYYTIPSLNQFTSAQGNWYAVEMQVLGAGTGATNGQATYQVVGIPNHWMPENVAIGTYPRFMSADRIGTAPAFDAVGAGNAASTTSLSWSHTLGASATAIVVAVHLNTSTGSPLVSATCGGVTMQSVAGTFLYASQFYVNMFVLMNPGTGAKTITVTCPSSLIAGNSISYTGCSGFGINSVVGSETTFAGSGTTATSGVWATDTSTRVVNIFGNNAISGSFTAYNQTQRYNKALTAAVNYSTVIGDAAGASSVTFSATEVSSSYGGIVCNLYGIVPSAPSTFTPTYSSNVPWFGISGTAGSTTEIPVVTEYSTNGGYTYNITSLVPWMVAGDFFDIIMLGGGGGGGYANNQYGNGGQPGNWTAITLQYGVDFPTSTTTISVTVGAGGLGGLPGSSGSTGGSSSVTITGYGTSTATGGVGGGVTGVAQSNDFGVGVTPEQWPTSSGIFYYGGGYQNVTAGAGQSPGGGSAGSNTFLYGPPSAGADGAVWIRAHQ